MWVGRLRLARAQMTPPRRPLSHGLVEYFRHRVGGPSRGSHVKGEDPLHRRMVLLLSPPEMGNSNLPPKLHPPPPLDSALKIVAAPYPEYVGAMTAIDGETETWGRHSGFLDLHRGETSIGAAKCRESSNISGLCPSPTHFGGKLLRLV